MTPLRSLSPAARGSLLVLFAAGFSGTIGPILSLLYQTGFTPLAFAVWRGAIGGGTLWLLILWQRRGNRRSAGSSSGAFRSASGSRLPAS